MTIKGWLNHDWLFAWGQIGQCSGGQDREYHGSISCLNRAKDGFFYINDQIWVWWYFGRFGQELIWAGKDWTWAWRFGQEIGRRTASHWWIGRVRIITSRVKFNIPFFCLLEWKIWWNFELVVNWRKTKPAVVSSYTCVLRDSMITWILPYSIDVLDRFHQNRASLVLGEIRTRETLQLRQVGWGLCAREHRATCSVHNGDEFSTWLGHTCRHLRHTFHDAQPKPRQNR